MQKRWVVKPEPESAITDSLATALNVEKAVARLLAQRGITSFEEARDFFRPQLSMLHDPFLMKDMDKAIERLRRAIASKEKVLIYGDYDVDGTTSVALVYSFLKDYVSEIEYYIPDRYKEGYGISTQGIDYAKEQGFSLIIALDCGIKSIDKIDYANTRNIDFIICDHHLPGSQIPSAAAVLDPKRADCAYPFKELSGCGVGFKLLQAFCRTEGVAEEMLYDYLDLVTVSIASDIVPIIEENRVLAFFGLKKLNSAPSPGLKTIIDLAGLKREIGITEIVFFIGPRINAAGRIKSGKSAVALLISENEEFALDPGKLLNEHNAERKTLDAVITKQALEMIEADVDYLHKKTTVVFSPEWHKGVVGIVASRLTEKYYRPTIVLTESNGMLTGSARSVKDFDVYLAIEACSEHLEQFGGHKYAAGLTMKKEQLNSFMEKFEAVVSATIPDHLLVPEIEIDAEVELSEITPRFYRILKQFAPFGPGNMSPVFLSKNVRDKGYCKVVGTSHLRFEACEQNPLFSIPAIGWQQADKYSLVRNQRFDFCYSPEENEFNGNVKLQLNVKDLRPTQG